MSQENVFEDLSKYSKKLMIDEPFYGFFLIGLNKEVTETRTNTACVSKQRINNQLTINPTFWNKQDNATKSAILKHELLHIGFFHLLQHSDYADKELFNIAADLEINQYIDQSMKGPTWVGLELSTFPELKLPSKVGTREYYTLLQKDVGTGKSPKLDALYNAMKQGEKTICSHELWEEFDNLSEAEKNLIRKQIDHQLKEIAEQVKSRGRGTIPSEMAAYINSLFEEHTPVIDWKAYFRRFMGLSSKVYTKKTRRKPNKRFIENPALKIKPKKNVLCAIDTSGSVSDDDLMEFFNEIHHIYKTGIHVTIVECDAAISNVYQYKGTIPEKVTGRGGTNFQPVIDYLEEHKKDYNVCVYLTDGECYPPTKPCRPMLWVICSDGQMNEELPGQKIKINR